MSISIGAPAGTVLSGERPSLSPAQIMQNAREREASVSRLLMAFISSGLVFMLLPGTFLGVWNLLRISGSESAGTVSPAWLQAHGHAQVFGWIGSFILGIGFYSIPKMRGGVKPAFGPAWFCWAMWTAGVTMRWAANVYRWQWRVMLPVSGILELAAFLIFFRAVSRHRPEGSGKKQLDPWIYVVVSAAVGFLLLLIANLAACVYLALRGATPALSHILDQRFLTLAVWGFLVPFVWGFSARWMTVLLGVSAVLWDSSGGIWGASRHALTVGFIAVMVFCVGQRILPAFAGMRQLWSSELMFAGLALLTIGCTLRVSSEILAYQGIAGWAWSVLPFSAMFELAGITAFATNILGTFLLEPSHAQKQAIVVEIR